MKAEAIEKWWMKSNDCNNEDTLEQVTDIEPAKSYIWAQIGIKSCAEDGNEEKTDCVKSRGDDG